MSTAVQKVKNFLFRRRMAYVQVFNTESEFAKIVLEDLAKFCRAYQSSFHQDSRAHAVLEGRREVWLRIMKHTKMDADQFIRTFGKNLDE